MGEVTMIITRQLLAACAAIFLIVGTAQAGPCNTATGQTTGTGASAVNEHPPTSTRATGDVASSSQESRQQMQGPPTATQHAQDPEPSAKMTDKDQPKDQPMASRQAQSAEPSEKMNDQGC
jgi:hypothetical protein